MMTASAKIYGCLAFLMALSLCQADGQPQLRHSLKDLIKLDPATTKEAMATSASGRELQTYRCKASDIAESLEDDFANFTTLNDAIPKRAFCSNANDNCPLTLYTYTDANFTNFTTSTIDQPCVTCDFFYSPVDTLEFKFASCIGDVECLPPLNDNINSITNDAEAEVTADERLATTNSTSITINDTEVQIEDFDVAEQVMYSVVYDRTDSFAIVEVGYSDLFSYNYLCEYKNEKRTFKQTYKTGVTNVKETILTLTNEAKDDGDNMFDICEYTIDGTPCNSCTVCGVDSLGLWEVDCSNIITDATSSCDSILDVIHTHSDIASKWFVYQDGFEHTEPPTVSPTMAPTSSPIVPKPDAAYSDAALADGVFAVMSIFVGGIAALWM